MRQDIYCLSSREQVRQGWVGESPSVEYSVEYSWVITPCCKISTPYWLVVSEYDVPKVFVCKKWYIFLVHPVLHFRQPVVVIEMKQFRGLWLCVHEILLAGLQPGVTPWIHDTSMEPTLDEIRRARLFRLPFHPISLYILTFRAGNCA